MKSILSNCCAAEIITEHRKEFPLGGSTWCETFRVNVCEKCHEDCHEQEYSICDYCGEQDEDLNDDGYCAGCGVATA